MSKPKRARKSARNVVRLVAPAADVKPIGLKIRPSHVGKPETPVKKSFAEMFPVAKPPPGVPDSAVIAMDEAFSPIFQYAGEGYYGADMAWPGFPYLAELTQRAEYRLITEVRAKEMTRKGFELTYSGEDEELAEKKLARMEQACHDFRVNDKLRVAAMHDGFYGGGQIYIDVCRPDDAKELAAKLVITKEKIPKGKLNGFKNIEPMWSYPAMYNSADPLHENFFKPEAWYVNGKTVNASRLLTMISREMPDILKPAYSFRGMSLTQMAQPYVDNWLRTRQSVSDLVHSFSIVVVLSNLQGQLGGDGWDTIYRRIDEFNALRDNRGAFVIDKDTEDAKNLAVPLGTLDALQAQAQEQMCSVSQTPVVKLLGLTPSGLNTSTDGEIRSFYDMIHAQQEHLFGNPLKVMLDCIQLNEFGEIDPDIGFKFVPLWQLDEAAEASVRKTNADTDAVFIEAGVLSPEDVRGMIVADKNSPYAGLDPDDLPEPPDMGEEPDDSGDPAKSLGESKKDERSGV